ncbi:SRPBCC domain-containing protein [Iamia sp. SCSIO 61187]|nr:SRPBCC domain-containing protein [Iamia sp. SCSIO 61187]
MRSSLRHQVLTSIDIPAPPDRVWHHLTAFDAYPAWNPFITDASGVLRVGDRLQVRLHPPGGRPQSFRPRVTVVEPGAVLAWQGRIGGPWLFAGDHRFALTPIAEGTRLDHGETFTGLLVPLLRRSLDGPTRDGFEAMNRALADRAGADAS